MATTWQHDKFVHIEKQKFYVMTPYGKNHII
jgi:hypothetical protein